MKNIRIGTCSWKYPSWKGIVYSTTREDVFLEEFARQFDTVEIDQWFWSLFTGSVPVLPKMETAAAYASSVPDDFLFTIKVPNSITLTHHYKKKGEIALVPNEHFLSPGLFNAFMERLAPMKSRIGMLMFQFEYLNRQKMKSFAEFRSKFGDFVHSIPRDCPIGIEIRNPNYLSSEYFEFCVETECSHVFLQGYYMPSIIDVYGKYGSLIKGTSVIRLHGTERGAIEGMTGGKWNEIVEPKDDELRGVLDMVRAMRDRGVRIFINVNNHYEGSAPLTIKKIKAGLGPA